MGTTRHAALLFGALWLAAVACAPEVVVRVTDDGTSTATSTSTATGTMTSTATGTQTGSSTGTTTSTATFTPTGTTTGTGSGSPPPCYQVGEALLLPGDGVFVDQGLCSPEQVAGFYTFCLQGGEPSEACLGFVDDNQACVDCLAGTASQSGPMPAVVVLPGTNFLMTYGCEAAVHGLAECAWPVQAYAFCADTACAECEPGSADADACREAAGADICADLGAAISDACTAVFELGGSAQCSGSDWQDTYGNIAEYFCG